MLPGVLPGLRVKTHIPDPILMRCLALAKIAGQLITKGRLATHRLFGPANSGSGGKMGTIGVEGLRYPGILQFQSQWSKTSKESKDRG